MAVIGAGFAGASVAAALARGGVRSGVIFEREPLPGVHASGRNAAMARQLEPDPILLRLAIEGVRRLGARRVDGRPVLNRTGGLYLIQGHQDRAAAWLGQLDRYGVPSELLPAGEARRRFPFLNGFAFEHACFCPTDGVVDIHALLTDLLAEAKAGGFEMVTRCAVDSLLVEGSAVRGLQMQSGGIRARVVIDATGAWAGRLGRTSNHLPLRALRRHLFVGVKDGILPSDAPLVWDLDAGYYVRLEGAGLLLSPCDETEHPPGVPSVDFEAADLLAEKLLRYAPSLADLAVRRSWACLRTFTPDRRPIVGWDPEIQGLFHVSGLGGFGVTTSLALGDLASTLISGGSVDWIDAGSFGAYRKALASAHPRPA